MNTVRKLKVTLSILLAFAIFISPVSASAADADAPAPCSSAYLHSYSAYIYDAGHGDLQVWFSVAGTSKMEQIGALTVILKESSDGGITWHTAKTFRHTAYSSMLGSNRLSYLSCVNYSGTVGYKYYAYVTVWAGRNGGGDSREILTSIVTLS